MYDNFKSPIWKFFDDIYGYCAMPNFLATVHHAIIFLLRISQLFVYCKSTNNFSTANRLNILLLCIEKLYDNFKSPVLKHFNDLYAYCAKDQFYGYCATIIFLLRISQLFVYCKSTNYFTNGKRLNICLLCIEKLYDNFKSPTSKYFDDLYGYCTNPNFLATAHLSFWYCASPNYLCTANRQIISRLQIVYIIVYCG